MRVLLDTNVLVSAVLFGGVPQQLVESALAGDLDLVTSPVLMSEFERVLYAKFKLRGTFAATVRGEFEALAEVVEPVEVPRILRDVPDNEVLAAAVAGRAELIVTGDKELLELGQYQGIRVVSPREMLERMQH